MKRRRQYLAACLALALFSAFLTPQAAAQQSREFSIGVIVPLTGPAAEIGIQYKRGLELASAAIQRKKAPSAQPLKLIFEDSQTDPKAGLSAFRRLLEEKDLLCVVSHMSSISMALAPLADERELVLFANAAHPLLTINHQFVFRNLPGVEPQVQLMAHFIKRELRKKDIALFYIEDAYGDAAHRTMKSLFPALGLDLVSAESFQLAESDYRSVVRRVLRREIGAVYLFGYGAAAVLVARELRQNGYAGALIGGYDLGVAPLRTAGEPVENAFLPVAANWLSPAGDEFRSQYRQAFGAEPEWNSAVDYDALMIIARAAAVHREQKVPLREALLQIGDYKGAAGAYRFSKTARQWELEMKVGQIRGGAVIPVNVSEGGS